MYAYIRSGVHMPLKLNMTEWKGQGEGRAEAASAAGEEEEISEEGQRRVHGNFHLMIFSHVGIK